MAQQIRVPTSFYHRAWDLYTRLLAGQDRFYTPRPWSSVEPAGRASWRLMVEAILLAQGLALTPPARRPRVPDSWDASPTSP